MLVYYAVARCLLEREITIICAHEPSWPFRATWARGTDTMTLNMAKLKADHFVSQAAIYALAIHEIAHEVASDHLSEKYHEELCRLAGKLAYHAPLSLARDITERDEAWRKAHPAADPYAF